MQLQLLWLWNLLVICSPACFTYIVVVKIYGEKNELWNAVDTRVSATIVAQKRNGCVYLQVSWPQRHAYDRKAGCDTTKPGPSYELSAISDTGRPAQKVVKSSLDTQQYPANDKACVNINLEG